MKRESITSVYTFAILAVAVGFVIAVISVQGFRCTFGNPFTKECMWAGNN